MIIRLVVSTLLISATSSMVPAQEYHASRLASEIAPSRIIRTSSGTPLPAGTYSVGSGGYFPTIDSAFRTLSEDGIAGGVTLELIDALYIAPADTFGFRLQGPIAGAGPNSRIVIKPATGKNVVVEGDRRAVMIFNSTSYVTIDGVGLTGATTLTIHSLTNPQYPVNRGIDFFYNADHNVVQNVTFICENTNGDGVGLMIAFPPNIVGTPDFTSPPDSNLIQNNFFKKGESAIWLSAYYSETPATGNIIRGNFVGSPTDSLITWGIQLEHVQHCIVENNVVQHLTGPSSLDPLAIGINSWCGYENTIRNNLVHTVHAYAGATYAVGILLSGLNAYHGSGDSVYNNMVYDVQNASTGLESRAAGIQMWCQDNPRVYFNTVSMTGSGHGANPLGSAALYIRISCAGVDAKNNILVNTRDESPYCASAIYDYSLSNLTSDHNNLFSGPSQTSALVRIGSTTYADLTGWRGQGRDQNSITFLPTFCGPDLRIDAACAQQVHAGIPIAGIAFDHYGNPRDPRTPDVGAQDFYVTGIAQGIGSPEDFSLIQNYPNPFNPTTAIGYQLPVVSRVDLRVFDLLGRVVAVLVDEEKHPGTYKAIWDASTMASGIYFYQLRAGGQAFIKKMILVR